MARAYIENYPHGPGGHCSSTALRDILKFYGHEFTEELIFGLGVGIGFVYYRHPDMKPPVYIGGRIFNLEEHLCSHLGIGLEVVQGLDSDEGWLLVKNMLDEGIPAMVHADVHYLDYLRAKVHFSGHRIVLVGYDDDRGMVYVADNDRESIQELPMESLRRARSSAYLPQPAENTFYRLVIPQRLHSLTGAIPKALEKAVHYNLHLPLERARFSVDGGSVSRGIQGLYDFASEMSDWPNVMDEETLGLLCKSIYVTAEKGGTGYGGNFRRIYGRFLLESASICSDDRLAYIGKEFISIGDRWSDLSFNFKDLSDCGEKAVDAAQPVAAEIHLRERAAFESLKLVSDSLLEAL